MTHKVPADTDTGSYAFMAPGFTLQEEVLISRNLGLSPFEALKTATINPAPTMRREDETGTVEVGKRAFRRSREETT